MTTTRHGDIWAAIREELPNLERQMIQFAEADKSVVAQVLLDSIARSLAAAVSRRLDELDELDSAKSR